MYDLTCAIGFSYIQELVSSLSTEDRQQLEGKVFYPSSPLDPGTSDTLQRHKDQSVVMELNKLPQNDIGTCYQK
jgi:hypothetical protein